MTVKGHKLTDNQAAVYTVLKDYGPLPDHALVPLAQHVEQEHQASSGIRTRRSELSGMGLVHVVRRVKTGSGRFANVHGVV